MRAGPLRGMGGSSVERRSTTRPQQPHSPQSTASPLAARPRWAPAVPTSRRATLFTLAQPADWRLSGEARWLEDVLSALNELSKEGRSTLPIGRDSELRNILKTGPYFHDGSVAKIEDAVRLMGKHQLGKQLF